MSFWSNLLNGVTSTLTGNPFGVITSVGNMVGNFVGQSNENKQQEKQNAFNAQEAEKNRQWQEQMVDKQNAYNSPSAQMQRFADAGLNPNLIYGTQINSASPSGGAQAQSVGLSKASEYAANKFRAFEVFNQMQNDKSAREVNESIVEKNEADADAARADASRTRATDARERTTFNLFDLPSFGPRLKAVEQTYKNLAETFNLIVAQTDLAAQQRTNVMVSTNNAVKQQEMAEERFPFEVALLISQIRKNKADVMLSQASAQNALSQASYYQELKVNYNQLRPYIIDQMKADTDNKQWQSVLQSLDAAFLTDSYDVRLSNLFKSGMVLMSEFRNNSADARLKNKQDYYYVDEKILMPFVKGIFTAGGDILKSLFK